MILSGPVIVATAAVAGAVLGWWPLFARIRRSLHTVTAGRGIRIAAAATTAATFGLVVWRFADASGRPLLPALLAFAAASTVLALVDLVELRLPNAVIVPTLAAVAVLLVLASWLTGEWLRLLWALAGCGAMFGVYLVLALISPRSMGMGDVKLAAPIGLLLGWFGLGAWLVGLLAAFVVGGLVALVALALRRVTLRGSIPFGPSMLAGAMVAVLLAG
jgi:leader peptidase (prepilin peptidase)/N-methyltransferase